MFDEPKMNATRHPHADLPIRRSPLFGINRFVLFCYKYSWCYPARRLIQIILHLELPSNVHAVQLRLPHPYNVIINPQATIGDNCTFYHNTTVGSKQFGKNVGVPVIGANVVVYPNSVILGRIHIGHNVGSSTFVMGKRVEIKETVG